MGSTSACPLPLSIYVKGGLKSPSQAMSPLSVSFSRRRKWSLRRGSTSSSVSKTMMSVSNSNKASPWLVLPPAGSVYTMYSPVEKKSVSFNDGGGEEEFRYVGSWRGWLVRFNLRSGDLTVVNPVSGRRIDLPSTKSLPVISTQDWSNHDIFPLQVSKVIISCSPEEEACRAMMVYGQADRLAFCAPGRSKEWTPIGATCYEIGPSWTLLGRVYEDMVYSAAKNLFVCITEFIIDDGDGAMPRPPFFFEMEAWDLSNPKYPGVVWLEDCLEVDPENRPRSEEEMAEILLWCVPTQYLVLDDDAGELFVVVRYVKRNPKYREDDSFPCKTIAFDVFKVDLQRRKLRYISQGPIMFVGSNHSFVVQHEDFPALQPNSVYFTDPYEYVPKDWHRLRGDHDIGVYDYGNTTFSPNYPPITISHPLKQNLPFPLWFTFT